jgi:hypothetical protein
MNMRRSNKSTLFLLALILLLIAPGLIPTTSAQNQPIAGNDLASQLSQQGLNAAANFFSIDPDSFKFNGVGFGADGFIHNSSLFADMPLAITSGSPYQIDVINKGTMQQTFNGSQVTIYAYEIYYYYTITLYTVGTAGVITCPRADKHDLIYKSGWGLDPWGLGSWSTVYIDFKNYNITAWSPNQDPVAKLANWGYLGKLTYDISIDPLMAFPPVVDAINGQWTYKGLYFGFVGTTYTAPRAKGIAQNFNVNIEGYTITASHGLNVTRTPTASGSSITSDGYIMEDDSFDAKYVGFTPKPYNSPHQILSPPNGTSLSMRSQASGQSVRTPSTFDTSTSALSFLTEAHDVTVSVPSLWLRPEVVVFAGTHNYIYKEWCPGHADMWFLGWVGDKIDIVQTKYADVTLGWDVWNVYEVLNFKTGVRILSLYDWNPAQTAIVNQTLGVPQSGPNWESGDRVITTAVEGAVTVESFFGGLFGSFFFIGCGVGLALVGFMTYRGYSKMSHRLEGTEKHASLWEDGLGGKWGLIIKIAIVVVLGIIFALLDMFLI